MKLAEPKSEGATPEVSTAERAAEEPAVATPATARRTFLEQSAIALGQSWATWWRQELRREARPAAGGWPGTLREARSRVDMLLLEMRGRKMSAITEAEREVAARTAYASARTEWRRHLDPETP